MLLLAITRDCNFIQSYLEGGCFLAISCNLIDNFGVHVSMFLPHRLYFDLSLKTSSIFTSSLFDHLAIINAMNENFAIIT